MPGAAENGAPELVADSGNFGVHEGPGVECSANDTTPRVNSSIPQGPRTPTVSASLIASRSVDNRTSIVIRALIGLGTCLVLAGYCHLRSMDTSDLHARLGLPDVPPSHGTDQPLDSARLAVVLADPARMKAAVPMGQGIEPAVWRDLGRLSWLWGSVKDATGSTDSEWSAAARAEIGESVKALRAWPIPGVAGPAVEITRLEAIPDGEIALLARHRGEIARYFEALYAVDHEKEYLSIKPSDPEAAGWLRQAGIETGLAGNRFDSAEEGAAFVDALYAAGASRVVIASESIQAEGPKWQHADAIRVVLPDDPAKREALFRMLNHEVEKEGFDLEDDRGQPVFYMWWD